MSPSNDVALSGAEYGLAGALLYRDAEADRHRGLELVVQARDSWLRRQICLQMVPNTEWWVARESARRGDRDAAIAVMRKAVDGMHQTGRLAHAVWGTGVLVEALLERGASATWPKPKRRSTGWRTCAPTKVRRCRNHAAAARALLAGARGDEVASTTS